jgi:hypothetical protein
VAVASGSAQRSLGGTVGPHVGRLVDKATLLQKRGPFSHQPSSPSTGSAVAVHHHLTVDVRVTRKIRVGQFVFSKVRVMRIVTR